MNRKRAYLIRLVTWDDLDSLDNKQLSELAYKLNSVISVHHAEIFNEDEFMKKCDDLATWNEIDPQQEACGYFEPRGESDVSEQDSDAAQIEMRIYPDK